MPNFVRGVDVCMEGKWKAAKYPNISPRKYQTLRRQQLRPEPTFCKRFSWKKDKNCKKKGEEKSCYIRKYLFVWFFIVERNIDIIFLVEIISRNKLKIAQTTIKIWRKISLSQKIDKLVSPTLDLKEIRPPGSEAAQHSKLTHL